MQEEKCDLCGVGMFTSPNSGVRLLVQHQTHSNFWSRSRLLFFVGDATLSFDCASPNLSDPSLRLLIFVRNSAGTVS